MGDWNFQTRPSTRKGKWVALQKLFNKETSELPVGRRAQDVYGAWHSLCSLRQADWSPFPSFPFSSRTWPAPEARVGTKGKTRPWNLIAIMGCHSSSDSRL
jgi:hypothetical protein